MTPLAGPTNEKRPPLTFVLALARGGVMGQGGRLPWDYPEDREHFQRLTVGHAVIMGRRTWDETGAALPGRRNLVVSRRVGLELAGAEVFSSVDAAIAAARSSDAEPCVIGGAAIFAASLPLVTRIELTEIDRDFDGDTRFTFDRSAFREASRRQGADPVLTFLTLLR